MKTRLIPAAKAIIFLLCCTFFLACSEEVLQIETATENTTRPEQRAIEVHTMTPEVDHKVLFKGQIKSLRGVDRVEYGFMWYEPDQEIIEVKEIKVGVTSEVLTFNHQIGELPKKPKLIVCSFARVAGTEETIIGEEVSFSNDL